MDSVLLDVELEAKRVERGRIRSGGRSIGRDHASHMGKRNANGGLIDRRLLHDGGKVSDCAADWTDRIGCETR